MNRGRPAMTKDLLPSERTLLEKFAHSDSVRSNSSAFAPASRLSIRGRRSCET